MISVFSGTPGSGKSAHLARVVRHALNRREPRLVIANFPLAPDAPVRQRDTYIYVPNSKLDAGRVRETCALWWRTHDFREDSIIFALDEVQMLFNSREWSQKGNKRMEWLELLSQSRKEGMQVILVAQNLMMIDNQFRMLVEYDVIHRKVGNYGVFGWLLALPFAGRLCVTNRVYVPLKEKLDSDWMVISKRDIRMYDSYARFEHRDGGGISQGD